MSLPETGQAPLFKDIKGLPQGGQAFWVETHDNKRVRFAFWNSGTRGTAVIFTGRTEYVEKYAATIDALTARQFSVVAIDWRGQGLATRPGDNTETGHVEDFAHYQSDLAAIMAHDALSNAPGPRVMVAHSMGGCIGLRSLYETQIFDIAIFSAPMWNVHLPLNLHPVAKFICGALKTLGLGKKRLPFITSPKSYVLEQEFEGNTLTSDEPTYDWLEENIMTHPELGLGGPSINWMRLALAEADMIAARAPVSIPTLTFLGEDEEIVSPQAIKAYHAKSGAGKLVMCPACRHEIFMEMPEKQVPVWHEIDAFLDAHVPTSASV